MAMEGDDATTTRRLRVRLTKPADWLDKDEEDESPPDQRLSRSSKRKAEVTLENLYLQENYKGPSSTPLETIFESPRPSKGIQQVEAGPDIALLMAQRKLKRLCVFSNHYQPPRSKLKQRKERALKMKRLTGVRVPLGKVFSEDDVLAAFSCLAEEEATTPCMSQDLEGDTSNLTRTPTPDSLVEGMINVLSSLQMDCEPSNESLNQASQETAPGQPHPSREKQPKCRGDLLPLNKVAISRSLSASTSPHQSASGTQVSQLSLAREKRLKRRSGLMCPEKTDSSLAPKSSSQGASSNLPLNSCSSKSARSQRKEQNTFPESEQHTASAKVPRLRLGNKRTPDSSPATPTKRPKTLKQPFMTSPSQHSKGRGKVKNQRVSRVELSLYHHSVLAVDSLNNTSLPSNTLLNTAISASNEDTVPQPPSPLLTSNKRGLSSKLCNTPIFTTTKEEEDSPSATFSGDGGGATSPSSPSAGLAALSLHSSPSQLSPHSKPRKIRRRSARLSVGSDIAEGLWRKLNNNNNDELPLGTVWAAISPIAQKGGGIKEVNIHRGDGDNPQPLPSTANDFSPMVQKVEGIREVNSHRGDNDGPPPLPSTTSTKKGRSKGRRRSNQFLPRPEIMNCGEEDTNTTIKNTPSFPAFSTKPTSSTSTLCLSQHSPTQLPANPTDLLGFVASSHHHTSPSILFTNSTPQEHPLPSPQPCIPLGQQEDNLKPPIHTTVSLTADVIPSDNSQVMFKGAMKTNNPYKNGKEVRGMNNSVILDSSTEGPITPQSPSAGANTATYSLLEGCFDLTTHSPTFPATFVPTLAPTPSPVQPPATLSHSLGAQKEEHPTTSGDDWDSPLISEILTNKTLIKMGKVYYGRSSTTKSPLPSPAPVIDS